MPQFCARLAWPRAKRQAPSSSDWWRWTRGITFFYEVTVAHAPPVAVLFGKAMCARHLGEASDKCTQRVGAADLQGQGFYQRTELHAARAPAEFEVEAAKHSRGCCLRPRLHTA
jgi:hypothetical protein